MWRETVSLVKLNVPIVRNAQLNKPFNAHMRLWSLILPNDNWEIERKSKFPLKLHMTLFKIFPIHSRKFRLNWFGTKNLFDLLNVKFGFKRLKVHLCAITKRSIQLGKITWTAPHEGTTSTWKILCTICKTKCRICGEVAHKRHFFFFFF